MELLDPVAHRVGGRLLERRQKLVQRRVEQANRDREPRHRLEDALEVALLHREQALECGAALVLLAREDHVAHDREPVLGHEHVLRPAEPDALGAELPRLRRVRGRVGVGPHAQAAQVIRPAEDGPEVLVDRGRHERNRADDHVAGPSVDRDDVPLAELVLTDLDGACLVVDREALAAGDARLAFPASYHGRVGGHTAVRREDALRHAHSVVVVRGGLPADEDDVLAGLAPLLRGIGIEHDRTRRGAGGRVESSRRDLDLRLRVDHGMEELVELARIDPRDGLLARDQCFVDHLDRGPQRRGGRPLPRSRLQDVELPLLDRELDVLQIAVVRLEAGERLHELLVGFGHPFLHAVDRLGRANAGDDVLPLRVREKLAEQPLFARCGVAGEADPCARCIAAVAEHHLDDVHGGAEIVRDLVGAPVDLSAWRIPRVEDGAIRAAELLTGVLREAVSGGVFVDLLEGPDQLAKVVGREVHVLRRSARRLEVAERLLEAMPVDAVHDLAVHLDQAAVRVVGEARVAGGLRETFDRHVVEPEVEDGVHHPGHRDRCAAANGDEQRVLLVTEPLARVILESREVLVDLAVEPLGDVSSRDHVRAAGIRRDREPGGDGNAELGHLDEADALPAEELSPTAGVLVEVVDVAHLREESTRTAPRAENPLGYVVVRVVYVAKSRPSRWRKATAYARKLVPISARRLTPSRRANGSG